jgi:hypothetical protein
MTLTSGPVGICTHPASTAKLAAAKTLALNLIIVSSSTRLQVVVTALQEPASSHLDNSTRTGNSRSGHRTGTKFVLVAVPMVLAAELQPLLMADSRTDMDIQGHRSSTSWVQRPTTSRADRRNSRDANVRRPSRPHDRVYALQMLAE